MRGEYFFGASKMAGVVGSSPRAWGILSQTKKEMERQRFIPTCVGNTDMTRRTASAVPVHPHVRGEYATALVMRTP